MFRNCRQTRYSTEIDDDDDDDDDDADDDDDDDNRKLDFGNQIDTSESLAGFHFFVRACYG